MEFLDFRLPGMDYLGSAICLAAMSFAFGSKYIFWGKTKDE